MAHEVETMVAVTGNGREVPWHRLGTFVPDVMTADEALRLGGLDWKVNLRPLYVRVGDRYTKVEGHFSTVRSSDNKPLGVVGSRYTPFQNIEAFDFFDDLVASREAKYETAGSLRDGTRVFLTAKMPKNILVAGKEEVEVYLLLTNTHDGTQPVTAAVTPVRVVCMNTLRMSLRSAKSIWRVRHTKNVGTKISEARRTLKLTIDYMNQFEQIASDLYKKEFSGQQLKDLLELPKLEVPIRAIPKIISLYDSSPNLEDSRGTAWAAYNAVTEYWDHFRNPRTIDALANSVMYDTDLKDRVFQALVAI